MKYTAEPYQKTGIQFQLDHPQCGVFADPGGGKTAMTLAAFVIRQSQGQVRRALIIAPRLVCYNVWPAEVEKWDQFRHLKTKIIHGDEKAQTLFQEVIEPTADICLINPEATEYLFSFFPEKWFQRKSGPPVMLPWDMMIIDESSKYKNPSSVRFKALKKYHKLFKYRVILTGTPAPNGLLDLWSQMYIVDSGVSLGKNITAYRNKYFENVNYNTRLYADYRPKAGADEQIQNAIAPKVIRFDASTFAELPPLVFNKIFVSLPAKAESYYRQIEREMFGELDGTVTETNSKYLLCRQIANGRHYETEDKDKIVKVHTEKTEALKDLVGELQGKPALISYYFRHDLDAIRDQFRGIPNIGADTPTPQINGNIRLWNAGQIPLLAVHPESMAHGLNLQSGGNDLIFYSLIDSLESWQQLIKRLHRRGVIGQVRVHVILAKGTVDEAIYSSLHNKAKVQQSLLDALREYRESKKPKTVVESLRV